MYGRATLEYQILCDGFVRYEVDEKRSDEASKGNLPAGTQEMGTPLREGSSNQKSLPYTPALVVVALTLAAVFIVRAYVSGLPAPNLFERKTAELISRAMSQYYQDHGVTTTDIHQLPDKHGQIRDRAKEHRILVVPRSSSDANTFRFTVEVDNISTEIAVLKN